MKKKTIVAVAVLLCMSLARCECHVSTGDLSVGLRDARLARDKGGDQPTTVFSPTETIWCLVEVGNPEESTLVVAKWYAVEVEGLDDGRLLDSTAMAGENEAIKFSLAPDPETPIRAGRYRVDLLLDGELDRSLEFEVKAGD